MKVLKEDMEKETMIINVNSNCSQVSQKINIRMSIYMVVMASYYNASNATDQLLHPKTPDHGVITVFRHLLRFERPTNYNSTHVYWCDHLIWGRPPAVNNLRCNPPHLRLDGSFAIHGVRPFL
jgi:hypothetical protein